MLRMIRKDAAHHFLIKRATWGFSEPTPYSVPVLCLAIDTEQQRRSYSADDEWPYELSWRLDIWARDLRDDLLLPGSQFSIPSCYDDFTGMIFTALSYEDELEGTEDNGIKIIQREADFLDLTIEGFIRHATASMPPTRFTVDARFTRKTPHEEISGKFHREALPPHEPPYGATYVPPNAA